MPIKNDDCLDFLRDIADDLNNMSLAVDRLERDHRKGTSEDSLIALRELRNRLDSMKNKLRGAFE